MQVIARLLTLARQAMRRRRPRVVIHLDAFTPEDRRAVTIITRGTP